MRKKIFLETFGCQMNIRDSELICGLLKNLDYEITHNLKEADVVIFNTCSVRKHAEDRVWSRIGRLSKQINTFISKKPIIGLVGCMAKNYKEEVFKRAPSVDFVVGPSDIQKIPWILEELFSHNYPSWDKNLLEKKFCETEGRLRPEEIYHTGFYEDKSHAYVVISEGCSNNCSYCIVPYVRGPLRNRDFRQIIKEIQLGISKGITKFTLLGQNVNAYRYEDVDFIGLLRMVNSLEGVKEFSFITSHPKDTTLDLFRAMAELDKLKKYLHLPVQSGSNRILNLMNRGYSREDYLKLVKDYRRIVKEGVLTTDIIVGFPTETEEDFSQTYTLVKEVEFNSAYIFKYSVRPYTEAQRLPDNVERNEKERRHRLILELQKEISRKKNSKCLPL